MFRRALVVVVLGFCPVLFGSSFGDGETATTIRGWGHVSDPDADCEIRATAGGNEVAMTVPGTPHDFAAELERWNAPRVLSKIKGGFVAEVKVGGEFSPGEESTIGGRKSYNGAGILLMADAQNYVSLQRAAFRGGNGDIRHYLNLEVRREGKLVMSRYSMNLKDQETFLRLERQGGRMTASVSGDGLQWRSYEPIEVEIASNLWIGVEAINSANAPFHCVFMNFALFHRVNGGPMDAAAPETAAAR